MMFMFEKSMVVIAFEPVGVAAFAAGVIVGLLIARSSARRVAVDPERAKPGDRKPADPTPSPPRRP